MDSVKGTGNCLHKGILEESCLHKRDSVKGAVKGAAFSKMDSVKGLAFTKWIL